MFSKTSEYGMRAMVFIAQKTLEDKRAGIAEIATETNTPKPFISKILQVLVRENLLDSVKGPNGGFKLKRKNITMEQVVVALEGKDFLTKCAMGLKKCNAANPCPIHHQFKDVRDNLIISLKSANLLGIAATQNENKYSIR